MKTTTEMQLVPISKLVPYVNNYYVQAVVMFMIISGGLGFMVWVEIGQYHKKHRLSLQAKVVLSFSVILWLGGAALIASPMLRGGMSVLLFPAADSAPS